MTDSLPEFMIDKFTRLLNISPCMYHIEVKFNLSPQTGHLLVFLSQ